VCVCVCCECCGCFCVCVCVISAGTSARKENARAALIFFLIFFCLLRISLQAASPLDTTEFEDVEKSDLTQVSLEP
jgi:hypothetical protein